MADFTPKAELSFSGTLKLSEAEMIALNGLTVYGTKAFLEGYKKQLGQSYMHEKGLESLFQAITDQVRPQLYDIEIARRDMTEATRKRNLQRQEESRQRHLEEEQRKVDQSEARFQRQLADRGYPPRPPKKRIRVSPGTR